MTSAVAAVRIRTGHTPSKCRLLSLRASRALHEVVLSPSWELWAWAACAEIVIRRAGRWLRSWRYHKAEARHGRPNWFWDTNWDDDASA